MFLFIFNTTYCVLNNFSLLWNYRGWEYMVKTSGKKVTSSKVATTASKILKDGRYSNAAKTVAGSALAQSKTKRK